MQTRYSVVVLSIDKDIKDILEMIENSIKIYRNLGLYLMTLNTNKRRIIIRTLGRLSKVEREEEFSQEKVKKLLESCQIIIFIGKIYNNIDIIREITQLINRMKIAKVIIYPSSKSNKKALEELINVSDTIFIVDKKKLAKASIIYSDREETEYPDKAIIKVIIENLLQGGLVGFYSSDLMEMLSLKSIGTIGFGMSKDYIRALHTALNNLFLDFKLSKVKGILLHIKGNKEFTLSKTLQIKKEAERILPPNTKVIWNAFIDENLDETITITTLVTGLKVSDYLHPSE